MVISLHASRKRCRVWIATETRVQSSAHIRLLSISYGQTKVIFGMGRIMLGLSQCAAASASQPAFHRVAMRVHAARVRFSARLK